MLPLIDKKNSQRRIYSFAGVWTFTIMIYHVDIYTHVIYMLYITEIAEKYLSTL